MFRGLFKLRERNVKNKIISNIFRINIRRKFAHKTFLHFTLKDNAALQ